MAAITNQISKARQIEWTTRRIVVALVAAAAFCLPFVGIVSMGLVLKLGWR